MRSCFSFVLALTASFFMTTAASDAAPAADLGERLAACIACHGKEGRTINAEYLPRIAGKPAGYLFNQLMNFRDGRRNNAAMSHLLQPLSDTYLREIAAYFSALDLPYPAPAASKATADALRRGETLVLRGDATRKLPACAQCHGTPLTGVSPAIPGLLGLPSAYISAQLGAWRAGQRRAHTPDCMASVAKALSPEDISAVAAWLSAQPLPSPAKPMAKLDAPLPVQCGGVPQ
ncbi:MAG: c-type cytochrome [Burkholderiales bacterium]|nr:c-type cytochrome [Burkholderiales bacterium]